MHEASVSALKRFGIGDDFVQLMNQKAGGIPMYLSSMTNWLKERDLVKQVNDELIERVIGQTVAYYAIDLDRTKWLVKGVSLEVKRGEIVTLIGPNGSGP